MPLRIRAPRRWPSLTTTICATVLAVCGVPSAAAQGRSAGIRVNAWVRDAATSAVIGAHAQAASDSRAASAVGAAAESGSWRISSGGSAQIVLQLEAADPATGEPLVSYVTICDDAGDGPADCRQHRAPFLRMRAGATLPGFVVRVGPGLGANPETPIRLTVASIAY